MQSSAFSFSLLNFEPATLLGALTGCPACFASASCVLNQLMAAKQFSVSFKPDATAVSIGPATLPFVIPPGLQIQLRKVRMYGFIYIYSGSMVLSSAGMSASLTTGPIDLHGLFKLQCGDCATPKKIGPTIALALTSSPSFAISGAIVVKTFPNPMKLNLVVDPSSLGSRRLSAPQSAPPFRYGDSSALLVAAGAPAGRLLAGSACSTAPAGPKFSINVATPPSNYGSVTFACSGILSKPASISMSFAAFFTSAAITTMMSGGLGYLSTSASAAAAAVSSSSSAFSQAKARYDDANNALASTQANWGGSINSAQNNADSIFAQCVDYRNSKQNAADSCSWKNPGACAFPSARCVRLAFARMRGDAPIRHADRSPPHLRAASSPLSPHTQAPASSTTLPLRTPASRCTMALSAR